MTLLANCAYWCAVLAFAIMFISQSIGLFSALMASDRREATQPMRFALFMLIEGLILTAINYGITRYFP